MPTRSRKETTRYHHHIKNLMPNAGCEFCAFSSKSTEVVNETKNFWVVNNIFPYTMWDLRDVTDHLMVVPKIHTDSLSDLDDAAAIEFVKLISNYEINGYSIYARAPDNPIKSVTHQHTHLIKGGKRRIRFLFFTTKPHVRVAK